jgi:hypothetical protein
MEHQMIAAFVLEEHRIANQRGALDHRYQRRLDALRARDRALAARSRADWSRRVRATLARGIRRIAEAIEPPRRVCVSSAPDPC